MIQMVVFDMDGVLVDIDSSWQAIHRDFGVDNEDNFQRYLQGEIDYIEFMRSDIKLWGNVHQDQIQRILMSVPLMEGVKSTFNQLQLAGKTTAIISSGLMLLANRLRSILNIDYVYANKLVTDDKGYLTGEGDAVVTLYNKGRVLEQLCADAEITPENCAVVGDSRFDIPLFTRAGLSIAFNAHDTMVNQTADISIRSSDLRKILPWVLTETLACSDLSFSYACPDHSATILKALSPDHLHLPKGLIITSYQRENVVQIRILCSKGLGSLLATLDDLLLNIQIIEKSIPLLDMSEKANLLKT